MLDFTSSTLYPAKYHISNPQSHAFITVAEVGERAWFGAYHGHGQNLPRFSSLDFKSLKYLRTQNILLLGEARIKGTSSFQMEIGLDLVCWCYKRRYKHCGVPNARHPPSDCNHLPHILSVENCTGQGNLQASDLSFHPPRADACAVERKSHLFLLKFSLHYCTYTCTNSTKKEGGRGSHAKHQPGVSGNNCTFPSLLTYSEKWYGSKPLHLGGSKKKNLESINKWVKDITEGQIPHFLSDLPQDVLLILLNAMHFKGVWKNTFDPSLTSEDSFYINDDMSVPVEMMSAQKYPFSWFFLESIESQVAKFQFKGNMSFVVLMPYSSTWNLSKLLANFSQSDLYSRFPREKNTNLKMPKLNLDYKLELRNPLTNLGLGQLFTNPDLSGITNEALVVSSIQHQSSLELNEEGVEASAVTAVITSRSHSVYRINRPFLFFLFEDTMGIPLFMGHVRNPNPGFQKTGFKDPKNFDKGYKMLGTPQ
uniref:Serpin peptidase inhibitor, clade F (alpha-2 antiplasmin, pigment epithelium-derived factor), member 2 n=1 Tax=Xenopus tropicalis TaxID=8364 RepID=F6SM07_XENTR